MRWLCSSSDGFSNSSATPSKASRLNSSTTGVSCSSASAGGGLRSTAKLDPPAGISIGEHAGGLRPPCTHASCEELRCQARQDFLAQLLRLAEKFLVFEENPVQFERLVGVELAAQHHVADVDGIGQGGVLAEFFKGGRGIVVVHASHSIASDDRLSHAPVWPGADVRRSAGAGVDQGLFDRLAGEHRLYRGRQEIGVLVECQSGVLEVGGRTLADEFFLVLLR